jgi:hypothetical protein
MSHLDGESPAAVFPVDVDVTWAVRVMGANATNAKAKTQLTYFGTRQFMRLSSAMKLND